MESRGGFFTFTDPKIIGKYLRPGFRAQSKAGQSGTAAQIQNQTVAAKGARISLQQLLQDPQALGPIK